MKAFLLVVKAWQMVVVEAKNEEEAFKKMGDDFSMGDWQHDETSVDKVLTTELDRTNAIRHGATVLNCE